MALRSLVQAIPVAPELEREARAGQTLAIPASDGMAEAASGIARELSQVGAYVGKLADHAAQVEGQQDGHLAGMDPEFRPRRDGTLRGEAFDKAALDTYLAQTKVSISNDIEQATLKHQADPKGLAGTLKGKEAGWLENVPVDLVPEIKTLFAHGSAVAQREATRQLWARQAAEQAGAVQEALAQGVRSLHQAAFAAGLGPDADTVLAGQMTSLEALLGRRGPNGQPLITPAAAAQLKANIREQVSTARLYGAFSRLPDVESKQRFIQQFEADFAGSTGAAKAFDMTTFETVRRHLDSELRRDAALAKQGSAVLGHLIGEVQKRADKGYSVNPAEVAQLQAEAATKGTPEQQAALDDALDSLKFQQGAKRLSLPELEVVVGQLRQDIAANPSSITDRGRINRRLEKAEALLTQAQGAVKENPLQWEARVGMIDLVPLGKVDMRQPGALEQWGALRLSQADETAKRHGLGKPVYLEPVERRALAKQFEQGGEAGLAAVASVRQAFGDRAEAVLAELGRKDAPVGAHVGTLALKTGITPAVADAAEGLHLRTRGGYKSIAPPERDSRDWVRAEAAAALGNAPDYLSSAIRTADAIYETRANREGKRDVPDAKIWKQAFREALGEHVKSDGRTYGGIVSVGGFFFGNKVVLPPSLPQDKAADTIAALTPEDLGGGMGGGPRFGNGRALTRQELRGATLVTVAPGKYWLQLGAGKYAGDGAGNKYVLDLEAALPEIRRRRPDLR